MAAFGVPVQAFTDFYGYFALPAAVPGVEAVVTRAYACLGAGAHGSVYVCVPLSTLPLRNSDVAEVMLREPPELRGCLAVKHVYVPDRERRIVAARESGLPIRALGEFHDNLVRVVDVFEEAVGDDQWCISCVMEMSPLAQPFPVPARRGIAGEILGPDHLAARQLAMMMGHSSFTSLTTNRVCVIPITDEAVVKSIMRQLFMALAHLHAPGVIHRDVKPDNILLFGATRTAEGRLIPLCKLTDYGLARARADVMTAGRGTAEYMAPELMEPGYDAKVDVFAAGCTLYTIVCGQHPSRRIEKAWPDRFDPSSLDAYFPVGSPMRAFLQRLTARAPVDRPTAAAALRDPWLTDSIDPLALPRVPL